MALAPLSAIVKPPVLYSFPSEIRIARPDEVRTYTVKLGEDEVVMRYRIVAGAQQRYEILFRGFTWTVEGD